MLSVEQIKTLGNDNVCKDENKSKHRISKDFLDAPVIVKHNIAYLSTYPSALIYQACKTGRANARIIIAMAQILNVTPYYYTGEEDKKSALTKDILLSFLEQHGYSELCDELRAADETVSGYSSIYEFLDNHEFNLVNHRFLAKRKNPVASFWENLYGTETATIKLTLRNTYDIHEHIEELTEDDAIALLKSLYVREKSDIQAGLVLETVKWLLLS